jgi:hypothetical protein
MDSVTVTATSALSAAVSADRPGAVTVSMLFVGYHDCMSRISARRHSAVAPGRVEIETPWGTVCSESTVCFGCTSASPARPRIVPSWYHDLHGGSLGLGVPVGRGAGWALAGRPQLASLGGPRSPAGMISASKFLAAGDNWMRTTTGPFAAGPHRLRQLLDECEA